MALEVVLSHSDLKTASDTVLGSVIPVTPGRMRNIWYPARRAQYMTQTQLLELGDKPIERDFNFGYTKEELDTADTIPVPERRATPGTSVKLLEVRSLDLPRDQG